jgi:hypothetical protein
MSGAPTSDAARMACGLLSSNDDGCQISTVYLSPNNDTLGEFPTMPSDTQNHLVDGHLKA